jgi:hypothetical protein
MRRTFTLVVVALAWSATAATAADNTDKKTDKTLASSLRAAATMTVSADAAGETDWTLRPIELGHRPRGAVLPSLYVSLAALQAVDAYTTVTGVRRGARESNAAMTGLAASPAALWAMKAGVTSGSIVLAERLWRSRRRAQAIAVMAAANGMMAAIATRNLSVLRAMR